MATVDTSMNSYSTAHTSAFKEHGILDIIVLRIEIYE
jgi:hypothetical protein